MNMMDFKNSNKIYTAPASMPDCQPLPVYQRTENEPLIISKWELQGEDEILALLLNKSVYIGINALRQPPVWMTTMTPFVEDANKTLADEEEARNQMEALIEEKVKTFLDESWSYENFTFDKDIKLLLTDFLRFCLGIEK